MNRTIAAAALAAALGLGAAAPAAATPLPKVHKGTFKVELEGVQRTSWTTEINSTEGCDLSIKGAGGETIRFRSKPTTVQVTWMGPTRVILRGRSVASLDLAATIRRHGRVDSSGEICSDGDGGGMPEAPDCGTRRSRRTVELSWPVRRSDLIAIEPDFNAPLGPFRTCPSGGISWPTLLDRRPDGRLVGAELPVADLFRHGKNITIARDKVVENQNGEQSTTTIRWTLSFTRVRGR